MEPAHSPFGLVGQIARDTGWSVDYIMRGVNCPMLMLMWQDFPRHVPGRKKTTQEMVAERRSRNGQPDIRISRNKGLPVRGRWLTSRR